MLTLKDIVTDEKELKFQTYYSPTLSLAKIAGQNIKDVVVQISDEHGFSQLRILYIHMEQGTVYLNDYDRIIEEIPGVDIGEAVLDDLEKQYHANRQ